MGVVDDIPHPPLVPSAASVPGVTVLQTPETMVDSSSFIFAAPTVTSEAPSAPFSAGPGLLPRTQDNQARERQKSIAERERSTLLYLILSNASTSGFVGMSWSQQFLGKLPAPAAIAAASVHKYWTSAFGKVTDNAELMELLKLAEMYTSRSHVLNCELYKVLTMKVDELRSTVGR
ncbi:hypothetical protein Fot_22327 [Forsythia ovata]|uniref:Uncharacterized protein n=1 Tax=Forsythia ovata TaxID=205694 RepID=A0ABD1UXD8_9LAMI